MAATEPQKSAIEEFLDPSFLNVEQVLDAIDDEVVLTEGLFGGPGLELRKCRPDERKLAIAISGGGAAGADSAGLLEVLLDRLRQRGVGIGMLVGTSSGAVNGYGVFVEALGKGNPQFDSEPSIRQPFRSYIASVWSYLARDGKASRWVAGRRSWIIRLASWGVPSHWREAGPVLLLLVLAVLSQPNLLLAPALVAARSGIASMQWIESDSLVDALPYLVGAALLAALAWLAAHAFGRSLFRDLPLLRLLANTGPDGDLRRRPRLSRSLTLDQARVLSRELAGEWYRRRDALPEFIVTSTDITVHRECLFTLVRPDTYARLLRREWMAVQFGSDSDGAKEYRSLPQALFALPENLVRTIMASSAVPGAFPSQRIGIYGPDSRQAAHHHFVDGGVLNNSPIHIAIDAGATHVISLEILPYEKIGPLQDDTRGQDGYGLLQASLTAFTTVLERVTEEDVRRTASWNRFLIHRPHSLRPGKATDPHRQRRIVPLYRIAPRQPLVGTVEFDGQFSEGK